MLVYPSMIPSLVFLLLLIQRPYILAFALASGSTSEGLFLNGVSLLKGCGSVETWFEWEISDLPLDAQTGEEKEKTLKARDALDEYHESVVFVENQNVDAALVHIESALALTPSAVPLLCLKANMLFSYYPKKARVAYHDLLKQRPAHAHATLQLGVLEKREGNCAEALAHFDRALRASPDTPSALIGRAACLYATIDQSKEDTAAVEKAIKAHEKALELPDADAQMFLSRMGKMYEMINNLKRAIEKFEAVVQAFPGSPEAHMDVARVLEARGKILEGFDRKGDTSESQRLIERAIAHLQQATWLNVTDVEAGIRLAELLSYRGRHGDAARVFERCVERRSDELGFFVQAADEFALAVDYKKAVEWYKRALLLAQSSDSNVGRVPRLLESLGVAMLKGGNALRAAKQLELSLRLSPLNVRARLYHGDALMKSGQLAESRKAYESVIVQRRVAREYLSSPSRSRTLGAPYAPIF